MPCSLVPPIAITIGAGGNATSNVAASSAPNYNPATTYTDAFVVIDPVTSVEFESLQNSNTGHSLADPLWWLPLGVENRLRMFDDSIGTQTSNAEMIEIVLDLKKIVTTLALLNILCTEVQVIVTDPVEGVKLDKTIKNVEPCGRSWWRWHFTPIARTDRILFDELPAYSQAIITIRIKNPGGTAKCGIGIIGQRTVLGMTQYGASVGFDDYSIKKRDDFGGFIISERAYSYNARFQVFVQGSMVDRLPRFLASYRAKAALYIGTEELSSTWIFGFFQGFENVYTEFEVSDCNIDVESVT